MFYVNQKRVWEPDAYQSCYEKLSPKYLWNDHNLLKKNHDKPGKNPNHKEQKQNHLSLEQMSYGGENHKQCLPGELDVSSKGNC